MHQLELAQPLPWLSVQHDRLPRARHLATARADAIEISVAFSGRRLSILSPDLLLFRWAELVVAKFDHDRSTESCALPSRPKATLRVRMNRSSSNGLDSNATAPDANAWVRTTTSSCAVMKMTGIARRARRRLACTSIPFMPGM